MSVTKRPSTSSLRRYLTSRPYIAVADIRRRFGLDPEAMSQVARNGTTAFIGLPEREATKLQDLWQRDEIGVELSVEVRAPVVVGIFPIRIARFVIDQATNGNGYHPPAFDPAPVPAPEPMRPLERMHSPEPMRPPEPMRAEPLRRPPAFEDAPEA
jgi:hypothetical protein